MSTYDKIAQKLNNDGASGAITTRISSPAELRELFHVTPEISQIIREAMPPQNQGVSLTRGILSGQIDELPEGMAAEVTLGAADTVTVADNAQWVIEKGANVSLAINTLQLGKGASIKVENSVFTLSVAKLVYGSYSGSSGITNGSIETDPTKTKVNYRIGIFGSTGENGTDGADKAAGANGAAGRDAKVSGGSVIVNKATDGAAGANGDNGENGQDGHDGYASQTAIITFKAIDPSVESIAISTQSGAGGNGGKGGKGGNGGNGGKGGKGDCFGCVTTDPANGSKGGNGGNGGKGGNGGNGVPGENIIIELPASFGKERIIISKSEAAPGSRGFGGAAGMAGAGGEGGDKGDAKRVDAGKHGEPGTAGTVGEDGADGTNRGLPANISIRQK